MIQSVINCISSLGFAIVATIGINLGTKEPRYDAIEQVGEKIEIRHYPTRVVAKTTERQPILPHRPFRYFGSFLLSVRSVCLRSFRYSAIAPKISFLTFSIVRSSRCWIPTFSLTFSGC